MKIADAIRREDHQEVLELLLEADETELEPLRPLLWKIKAVALLKMRQADRAAEALRGRPEEDAESAFLAAYTLYLQNKYAEAAEACRGGTEPHVRLLRAQSLARSERFAESLAEFGNLLSDANFPAREEVLIDSAYVLATRLVAEGCAALDDTGRLFLAHLLGLHSKAEGELALNILRVLTEALTLDDCPQVAELQPAAETLLSRLRPGLTLGIDVLETEGIDLTDRLAFLGLRMRLRPPEEVTDAELDVLRRILTGPRARILDVQLRLELLSGMLRCLLATERQTQCGGVLAQLEETARHLPRTGRLQRLLTAQVGLVRAATFLSIDRAAEVRQVFRTDPRLDCTLAALSVDLALALHHRNPRELQQRTAALAADASSPRLRCAVALLSLAYFHRLNFQKKYAELLLDFARRFFLEQLRLPGDQRFLNATTFATFARIVLTHVLRCAPVLRELREELAVCAQFVDEPQLAAHVAEGCAARGDYETAQRVYEALLQREPENTLFASRLNVIYSITAPERIDDSLLPEFELITDANALRELENDYVRLLRKDDSGTAAQPAAAEHRPKAKKRRIRWPKGFDFEAPGPRPDPERWLPKHERTRFRRKSAKKAVGSRTQGATAVSAQTTEMFADPHSTASRAAAKAPSKKSR